MLIIRGVNVFPTQIEEQILKVKALAPHYQLVLTRDGRMDAMEVMVEAASAEPGDHRDAAAHELQHLIKSLIGVTTKVSVLDPGGVERSQGKAKRVVDKRGAT
jgi:phenylacetate-CoA ligase